MVRVIDREAGVAAFRKGRSLCLRLHGTLDGRMGQSAIEILRADRWALRLHLECSTLRAVDPAAARALTDAIAGWASRAGGRSAAVHNLDPVLQDRLPLHSLRSFLDADELVFFDPERAPYRAAAPSRH